MIFNIFLNFVPQTGIIYLKLKSSWIFAWCNKSSLCKSLFLFYICLFVTISYQIPFWNNSSSRGRILKCFDTFKE